MGTWNREQKVCATCAFWTGKRDLDFSGEIFTTLETEGRCDGPHSSFNATSAGEALTCPIWELFFL
ncbi:MAG TPA: hypothetical protein PKI19_02320 [Elusimicrobiales bacterium]|nr:hypothetical protein [Elusimicrobiales bacterium]